MGRADDHLQHLAMAHLRNKPGGSRCYLGAFVLYLLSWSSFFVLVFCLFVVFDVHIAGKLARGRINNRNKTRNIIGINRRKLDTCKAAREQRRLSIFNLYEVERF